MRPPSTTPILVNLLSDAPDWTVLSDDAIWDLIKEESVPQGVAPLIAFLTRTHVSPGQREWCDRILTRSWNKHDAALQRLGRITGLLNDAGIRTLALKGPSLAQRHYSPFFLRKPPLDLDLAVMPADLGRAVEILKAEDYTLNTAIADAVKTSHHLVLVHPKKSPLELHFRMSHGVGGIPVDQFFERAIPYVIPGGPSTWVLQPADELFYLILHLVHDRFPTLFHSWEVRRMWNNSSPEVHRQVIKKAVDHRFVGPLALSDIAIRSVWGQPILPRDSALPKTWLHRRLNEKLYLGMTSAARPQGEDTLATRMRGRWFELQTTDTPADALRRLVSIFYIACRQLRHGNWRTGRFSAS